MPVTFIYFFIYFLKITDTLSTRKAVNQHFLKKIIKETITKNGKKTTKLVFSECLLRLGVLRVLCCSVCVFLCTGHFVMVPLNLTSLHCLQHSFFEHLYNLYSNVNNIQCMVPYTCIYTTMIYCTMI